MSKRGKIQGGAPHTASPLFCRKNKRRALIPAACKSPRKGGFGAPGGDTSAQKRLVPLLAQRGERWVLIPAACKSPRKGGFGAPGGDRTHNLQRRRLTRYPIAPRVHGMKLYSGSESRRGGVAFSVRRHP